MATRKKNGTRKSKTRSSTRATFVAARRHADASPFRFEGRAYMAVGTLQRNPALITGGDSGVGRAVAFFFALEGTDIAIN